MRLHKQVRPDVYIGPQPTMDQLYEARYVGIRTVI